ncbi:MAG: trehalose 6-phosphate phosphatase [Thermoleophilaceae bacterium]|nr:trehalose 6-phosphate phosphatase [Thermoleophilaceae bacterium]
MDALRPVTQDPSRAGIFLDVDGTLAPIVERAEDACVPQATVDALERLSGRYACVACVSGRAAADARRLVGLDSITYAGSHGAELLLPGEDEAEVAPAFAEWAPRVREFVESRELGDLRVEQKGAIVALHWRGAEDEEARAREIADEANGFITHWGRKVLEIRPPVEVNKGVAVTELIRRHDLRAGLFAGDDVTDLDGFAALGALPAAVRVGVRSDEGPAAIVERADVVVDGPEGMADVLAALA